MSLSRSFRIVLDTNTLLRGLASPGGAAGGVLTLCEQRRVVLLLSQRLPNIKVLQPLEFINDFEIQNF